MKPAPPFAPPVEEGRGRAVMYDSAKPHSEPQSWPPQALHFQVRGPRPRGGMAPSSVPLLGRLASRHKLGLEENDLECLIWLVPKNLCVPLIYILSFLSLAPRGMASNSSWGVRWGASLLELGAFQDLDCRRLCIMSLSSPHHAPPLCPGLVMWP